MHLAISILTSELESYRRCAREELKYSVYPEYRGPNEDFGKNILELQQAIAHLQAVGPKTQPITGNNTSAEEPPSPQGEITPSCQTCSRLSMGIFCLTCKNLSNWHSA